MLEVGLAGLPLCMLWFHQFCSVCLCHYIITPLRSLSAWISVCEPSVYMHAWLCLRIKNRWMRFLGMWLRQYSQVCNKIFSCPKLWMNLRTCCCKFVCCFLFLNVKPLSLLLFLLPLSLSLLLYARIINIQLYCTNNCKYSLFWNK